MAHKKWLIANADKEKASAISEKFNMDAFVAYLLVARGFDDELKVSEFISSSVRISDPFELSGMDSAVDRIEQAVSLGEKITVYGDYDCDGVTATALLYSLLRDMGAEVDYYIPSRETEGYGLNQGALKKIAESGTRLIVTVDNGISAVAEAEYAYSLGMELVITDHHQIPDTLPRAQAIVNPHLQDGELAFTDLAGVGVAFKLAAALYGDTDDILYQYADLAAIGTIADIMPLTDENRSIVKTGIRRIQDAPRPGIAALLKAAGLSKKEITSSDIAFSVCPRINATGRMEHAAKAVELLVCSDPQKADFTAEQLNINNTHRQEIEQEIYEDVIRQISEEPALAKKRVIVVAGKGYHQGVVGIVASRITEKYEKPAVIIGVDDEENARGSARSISGFNIFEAVCACSDLLSHFGGHPGAAGLSLNAADIDLFRNRINAFAAEKYPVMPVQTVGIDFKISPLYLSVDLAKALNVLEPYGEGNKRAVFALMNLTLTDIRSIGNGKHIRLECEKKGKKIRIVQFGTPAEKFPYIPGEKIDAAVKIGVNPYNGREYLSVQAVDIRKHGMDEDAYFAQKEEYELFLAGKNNAESVYPDHDVCAAVYKAIRKRKQIYTDADSLYFSLSGATYGQMMFALKAFYESSLISFENGEIKLRETSGKVDLADTKTIKYLKGRLNIERF